MRRSLCVLHLTTGWWTAPPAVPLKAVSREKSQSSGRLCVRVEAAGCCRQFSRRDYVEISPSARLARANDAVFYPEPHPNREPGGGAHRIVWFVSARIASPPP